MSYDVKYKMGCVVKKLRKFKLPAIPQTTQKTIRFPNEVIDQIEEAICGTGVTFSAFIIEAAKVALDNLHEEEEES